MMIKSHNLPFWKHIMSRPRLWHQGQNQNLESSHMLIITLNFSCCSYYSHIIGKSKISACILEIIAESTEMGIWQSLWDKQLQIMGYRLHLQIQIEAGEHYANLLYIFSFTNW